MPAEVDANRVEVRLPVVVSVVVGAVMLTVTAIYGLNNMIEKEIEQQLSARLNPIEQQLRDQSRELRGVKDALEAVRLEMARREK